jgi:glutathione reductase (NADPH)
LVERGSNHILGAHILGPHAEEVVNIFALAIRLGLDAEKIREAIFALLRTLLILAKCYRSVDVDV